MSEIQIAQKISPWNYHQGDRLKAGSPSPLIHPRVLDWLWAISLREICHPDFKHSTSFHQLPVTKPLACAVAFSSTAHDSGGGVSGKSEECPEDRNYRSFSFAEF